MSAYQSDTSPWLPCARCGKALRYTDSVPGEINRFGGVGFAHPLGQCDPTAVAERAEMVERVAAANSRRHERVIA